MNGLTKIFKALLGLIALMCAIPIALGRLVWCKIRNWWKKSAKWFRWIMATSMALFSVGFVAVVGYALYVDNYGRYYYANNHLSKNVKVYMFKDDTYRVYDVCKGEYTTPKLNWISDAPQNDSLSVYAVTGKRGYININTGKIVINAEENEYSKAWVFSEGLAAVKRGDKIGFINAKNEVVIPFKYDYYNKERNYGFGYLFHNGFCVMTNAEGRLGLIDIKGNWKREAIYDDISEPKWRGCRLISRNGMYGVLDSMCKEIYPVEYNSIGIVQDGFVLSKVGAKWKEDDNGKMLQPFMFDETELLSHQESTNEYDYEYILSDYAKYKVDNCYGLMKRSTGKPITLAIYSDIEMFSKTSFKVQNAETSDWYLIDTNGTPIPKN